MKHLALKINTAVIQTLYAIEVVSAWGQTIDFIRYMEGFQAFLTSCTRIYEHRSTQTFDLHCGR